MAYDGGTRVMGSGGGTTVEGTDTTAPAGQDGHAAPRETAGRTWIFACNPKFHNLAADLPLYAEGDTMNWSIRQHREEIHAGDRVILWMGGEDAGLYATGILAGDPYDRYWEVSPPEAERRPYMASARWADLTFTCIFPRPITRRELMAHPILRDLPMLRARRGTNFPVTPEQWGALQPLLPPPNDWAERAVRSLPEVHDLVRDMTPVLNSLRRQVNALADALSAEALDPHEFALMDQSAADRIPQLLAVARRLGDLCTTLELPLAATHIAYAVWNLGKAAELGTRVGAEGEDTPTLVGGAFSYCLTALVHFGHSLMVAQAEETDDDSWDGINLQRQAVILASILRAGELQQAELTPIGHHSEYRDEEDGAWLEIRSYWGKDPGEGWGWVKLDLELDSEEDGDEEEDELPAILDEIFDNPFWDRPLIAFLTAVGEDLDELAEADEIDPADLAVRGHMIVSVLQRLDARLGDVQAWVTAGDDPILAGAEQALHWVSVQLDAAARSLEAAVQAREAEAWPEERTHLLGALHATGPAAALLGLIERPGGDEDLDG
ncbi:MAG TPA: EVE domain-containing protein [Chloroflexota bacterium]|nr:EVE domain-containing protein [Chloroflexota bacterium]